MPLPPYTAGVALSAKKMGIRAVIVMPTTTPKVKVDAVRGDNGKRGATFDLAALTTTYKSAMFDRYLNCALEVEALPTVCLRSWSEMCDCLGLSG